MKMTGILLALSLWGSVFAVCRIGRIRFWFAPVVAISGIGLFLFAGALTGKLPLFADLALAAGLAGSGYFAGCLARKKTAFPGWTLPGVCIGALAGIFCLLTLSLKLTHYDNFSHWALIVKYLLLVEELPGAESTMIPFRDYPPGVSLIIYYICRYAGHSQGMMLLAQNGVLFACFFALAGIVEDGKARGEGDNITAVLIKAAESPLSAPEPGGLRGLLGRLGKKKDQGPERQPGAVLVETAQIVYTQERI